MILFCKNINRGLYGPTEVLHIMIYEFCCFKKNKTTFISQPSNPLGFSPLVLLFWKSFVQDMCVALADRHSLLLNGCSRCLSWWSSTRPTWSAAWRRRWRRTSRWSWRSEKLHLHTDHVPSEHNKHVIHSLSAVLTPQVLWSLQHGHGDQLSLQCWHRLSEQPCRPLRQQHQEDAEVWHFQRSLPYR